MNDWGPHGTGRWSQRRPTVGETVAFDRRAWEVMDVADAEPTGHEQDRLAGYVEPWRDRMLPYKVTLRRLHGEPHEHENSASDVGFRVPVGGSNHMPVYPHGRVPLCSCHGHPWPCLEADQQRQAEAELARAEREMALLPGCCPGCQEPVTDRQRSIEFPGPNVRNPLGDPNPRFHLRRKCYSAAARYEDEWVAADPSAPRSLLTLRCTGSVVVHGDGTGECFGADGSDCPSVYARHRGYFACYTQTHGCGRECPTQNHPGTHLAGRPKDPRAVTVVSRR